MAVKVYTKTSEHNPEDLKSEIELLQNLEHPHVIKLIEVVETAQYMYLTFTSVGEYVLGSSPVFRPRHSQQLRVH